ncbi:MAG: IclR family transcriptional regulator [Streptosporangiaceae bacterium]
MTTPRGEVATSPSVATAFRIVEMLASRPGGARLSELARELAVPKSSALRILNTLCELDIVRSDQETKAYRIGRRMLSYAAGPLELAEPDLLREFYRIAAPIHARLDETIQLAVLSSPDVMFLARIDSTKVVRLVTQIGRRLPAHATAAGKAILAYSDSGEVDKVLAAGLHSRTDNTITDPGEFLRVLEKVRMEGYATEVEEASANLSCFSAPVSGADGRARAGMTICVPTGRVGADRSAELIDAVRAGAQALSKALLA